MTAHPLLALAIGLALGCGPSVGSNSTSDESSNGSTNGEGSGGTFDASWAIGTFIMEREEPAGFFLTLEIPEQGRAVATRYVCDRDGGPTFSDLVTPLEWRAVSESVLEVIPPVPGEKFQYGSGYTLDLFIERPPAGDGVIVYRSTTTDQWPHYGSFLRGRACEYFEGGMSCMENHYYRVCPE